MESWIAWARGPAFVFAFSFMLLGLARHAVLTFLEVIRAMQRAGDKKLPVGKLFMDTVTWLFPFSKMKDRFFYSLSSVVFHVAVLVVPVFLAGHIALWTRGLGVSWPAINNQTADVLTFLALLASLSLIVQRAMAKSTRALSRFSDYAIVLLLAVPFVSGYFAMHPAANPFSHDVTLFVHIMSANLIFVLVPISKLSHMVLIPGVQWVSEVAWHWPPDAGSKLAVTLGKENEPL
jgi:nitrate reductase gamma subunit